MRSSPWFHQRRSESAPPAQREKEPPSISQKEQEEITERISRPTESALYRKSIYWKIDSFMDRGFHSWSKMDLFDDCKRCMWTQDGRVKTSYKIRPNDVSTSSSLNVHLPPLSSARDRTSAHMDVRPSGRDRFSGSENGSTTNRLMKMENSGVCIRSVEGLSTKNKHSPVLRGGLSMLGNVSGARYRLCGRPTSKAYLNNRRNINEHSLCVPRVTSVSAN